MIHYFTLLGRFIVLDVGSGAVFELDENAYSLLPRIQYPMREEPPDDLNAEQREAWSELFSLYKQGLLYSEEPEKPSLPGETPLKALCLHVSHDCNLRCEYCFAHTGDFGGQRSLMNKKTAERAIDFLLSRCGTRKNLEIDFFGGEPLLALDTVKHTIEYARQTAPCKNFRFTITTNGLLLDDSTIEYLNKEMSNVVLSLDGRREVNDLMRKTPNGKGSYDVCAPKFKKLLAKREGDAYIRGTYTAQNLDFTADIMSLAAEGFKSLSVEPVVLPRGHKLAITKEHLPFLFGQYEKLCKEMLNDVDFTFFHFNVDLEQGPCVYKRLRGCGAGFEYAAVTPEGDIYPCHQFAGNKDYLMGNVYNGSLSDSISSRFRELDIYTKPDCKACWARFYCSGGCAASNLTTSGNIEISDSIGCELEKKRLECAILLKASEIT